MNFNILLLEAAEYNDEYELAKAILRGQIPGVSAKKFFGEDRLPIVERAIKNKTEATGILALRQIINLKNNFRKQDQNAAIALLLKKAGYLDKITRDIDPYLTYFDNRNKIEVKQNEEIKKLFKKFEEVDADDDFNKTFEQKINSFFAQKAKMKSSNEIEVIYPQDDEGWEVLSPKTFAASRQLACMNGRKSRWCTAASEEMFERYSNGDNKLFIIRNEKTDKMYQMDFGETKNRGSPNFKNEQDRSLYIDELEKEIPSYILDVIKNKKGQSVSYLLGKKDEGEITELDKQWKLENLKKEELLKIEEKYKLKYHPGYDPVNYKTVEARMQNNSSFYYLHNNERKFLLIFIKNNFSDVFELVEKNSHFSAIKRKVQTLLKEKLPEHIKKVILKVDVKEEPNFKKITHEGVDFYIIKNKEALYKFVPEKLFKSLTGQGTNYSIKEKILLRDKMNIVHFKGNLEYGYYTNSYFINLNNLKRFVAVRKDKPNFYNYTATDLLIDKNERGMTNKAVSSFLEKYYPSVYNYIKSKHGKTENEEEKEYNKLKSNLLNEKYIIYNVEGNKLAYFPSKNSFKSFIVDKKLDLEDVEKELGKSAGLFIIDKMMYYQDNKLIKIPMQIKEKLAQKYIFLKKNIKDFFAISVKHNKDDYKDAKNDLNIARKEYKEAVIRKVKARIKNENN